MNYRNVTVHPLEALSAAGTKTIDIKGVDVISRLLIKFILTKTVAAHTMSAHPAKDITKIELVDGSDLLFSLTGYEAQALNIYDRKVGSMCAGVHMASVGEESWYGLDFGRYLFDPVLALDPKRFKNLQLKITYTLTSVDPLATAGSIEVFSDVFDQKVVTPMGFLMSKEHYSYTPGADGSYEYIELPTDYPFRKMLVRAFTSAYEPEYTIESVRLDEENQKRIPLDLTLAKYISQMRGIWPEVTEQFAVIAYTSERVYYVTPSNYFVAVSGIWTGDEKLTSTGGWPRGGKIAISTAGGQNFYGQVHGFAPNHCIEFPFGDPKDIDDWYDVTQLQSLRLRLEAGSSGTGGAVQVVLQQLRKY